MLGEFQKIQEICKTRGTKIDEEIPEIIESKVATPKIQTVEFEPIWANWKNVQWWRKSQNIRKSTKNEGFWGTVFILHFLEHPVVSPEGKIGLMVTPIEGAFKNWKS